MKFARCILVGLFVFSVLGGLSVSAQDTTTVTYDAPVEGTIDATAPTQIWQFQPATADRIAIRVERLTGNLIPTVDLLDANGSSLTTSYGSDYTGAVAEIANFTLPSGGSYQIAVSRDGAENGATTGTYRLTVTPLGFAADHPSITEIAGTLALDSSVTGEITGPIWQRSYTLTVEEGDRVNLVVERIAGTIFPELEITDVNGSVVSNGYTYGSQDHSYIDYVEFASAGDYTVTVRRYRGIDGATSGTFELFANLLGSGENAPRITGQTPGTVTAYDTPVQGTITNTQWYQLWQFTTLAADTITVTVQRSPADTAETPNNLMPEVALLGAAGQELQRGYVTDTGDKVSIERYDIEAPGTYTIRVERTGGKSGVSTGTYELTVALVGAGVGSPTLTDMSGNLTLGTPVTGEISAARWADTWVYTAQGGEVVNITATRTGGTLVPYIEIQDANGQPIRSAYADYNTYDFALFEGITLDVAGDYRIVVMRDGGQTGYTSGTFELKIEQAPQ